MRGEGATENTTVVKELLEDLVGRGLSPDHKRLFVIDGSKAPLAAINAVFGNQDPVQRCRPRAGRSEGSGAVGDTSGLATRREEQHGAA